MRSDRFEWGDAKADGNFAKHKVAFEDACKAIDDPNAIEFLQDHATEERTLLVGTAEGRVLAVVYTERDYA